MKKIFIFFLLLSFNVYSVKFEQVVDESSENAKILKNQFKTVVKLLYGDQTIALKKIFNFKDSEAYLLTDEDMVLGVLVFKNFLSNEFEYLGINNVLELKTLFVVNSRTNSRRGFGSALLNFCIKRAEELNATGIFVTVSEIRKDALGFFQRKSFKVLACEDGLYQKDVIEYFLFLNLLD